MDFNGKHRKRGRNFAICKAKARNDLKNREYEKIEKWYYNCQPVLNSELKLQIKARQDGEMNFSRGWGMSVDFHTELLQSFLCRSSSSSSRSEYDAQSGVH